MRRTNQRRAKPWRRYLTVAIIALVCLSAIVWLLPRRVNDVVSVDGQHRWQQRAAPPQSRIVWQPAEEISVAAVDADSRDSLVRPQLADGGASLYFTVQRADGSTDICRSLFDGQRWSPGEAVAALNSPADDFGPVIAADGRELYLYSNRPGGVGGFDIYVARRTSDGWSKPTNLGERFNTIADDYDPAIAPDGQRLYFSSNRTSAMRARLQKANDKEDATWKATLRAEPSLRQFDLYVAARDSKRGDWAKPQPLPQLNLPTANEGEPFVAPNGAFLYFASDRRNVHGARVNYDLYRARIDGDRILGPENLGRGINTSANEHDPALSPEGFRILFSSDRTATSSNAEPTPEAYALYVSQASEIYDKAAWDLSHWGLIARNWSTIVLVLLLIGLVAALLWYVRQVTLKRAPVPAFFLAALVLHLLLASGAFFVPLDGVTLAERIKKQIDKIVATHVELDSSQPPRQPREQMYEKVADLPAPDAVPVAAAQQQPAPAPEIAIAQETIARATPRQIVAARSPQPVVAQAPTNTPAREETPLLQRRRRPLEQQVAAHQVPLEQVQPAQPLPSNSPVPPEALALDKTQAKTPDIAAPTNPLDVNRTETIQRERVDATRLASAATPRSTATEMPLLQRQRRPVIAPAEQAPATLEQTAAASSDPATDAPFTSEVNVARQAPPTASPFDATTINAPSRETRPTPVSNPSINAERSTLANATLPPARAESSLDAVARLLGRKSAQPIEVADAAATITGVEASSQPTDSPAEESIRGSEVKLQRTANATDALAEAFAEDAQGVTMQRSGGELATASTAVRQALAAIPQSRAKLGSPFEFQRAPLTADVAVATGQAPLEAVTTDAADMSDNSAAIDGVDVTLAHSGDVNDVDTLASAFDAAHGTVRGVPSLNQIAKVELTANPDFQSHSSPLARRGARSPLMMYARGKVGLQSMLRLRVGDDATKKELIEAFGGQDETLAAIHRGLTWLAQVQHDDGHWDLKNFANPPKGQKFTGQGRSKSDTAATGLALLPFLGDGHTHQGGKYQQQVDRGLKRLIAGQDEDGNLFTGGEGNAHMYSHGIAAIALCEAYGMTKDDTLRGPAQLAIDYIVKAQHGEGGWRYRPGDAGDTSVVGWQVMSLKSAQMAGLTVPDDTLNKARNYLERVRRGKNEAEFRYQRGGRVTPAMTAEGLLCYQYLGAQAGDAKLRRTVEVLAARPPREGQDTSYYWYYGTQAMFHVQGEPWQKWNDAMSDAVLSQQITEGPMRGTWNPRDNWEKSGGRIMATSLRLLMLEVYFRHLPLYQALD